jgi:hypothetical protein
VIILKKGNNMKIRYYLVDNPMTPDPNDRRAQVVGYEVVTEKELFEYMTRQGSAITIAEAKANYEEIIGALVYFIKQGYGISTEFILVQPVMQGVYRNDSDTFDRSRHSVRNRVRLGRRYNGVSDEVKVEKIDPPANQPLLVAFEDIASETINDVLTAGGTAVLTGMRLRFKQEDPQQGIFLVDPAKKEARVERILNQTSKKIVFQIPATLVTDEYTLEVRALLPGNKTLKTGVLSEKLSL